MNKSEVGGIRYAGYELDFMTFRGISRRGRLALTLVEVLVIVVLILLILGILLPGLAKTYRHPPGQRCVNNLKNIGLAFRLYATDNLDKYPTFVRSNGVQHPQASNAFWFYQVLSNELATPKYVICREDRERKEASDFKSFGNENVSYFVGLNASETDPKSFLAGDRSIVTKFGQAKPGLLVISTNERVSWVENIHRKIGNVARGDGSVQMLSSSKLEEQISNSGLNEVRLSIP